MSFAASRNPTVAYIAPFVAYIGLLTVEHSIPWPTPVLHALRLAIVLAVIGFVSWPVLSLRPSYPLASAGIGIAVFLIWIGPDLLFGYRHHWLFENSITGQAKSALPASLKQDYFFIAIRLLTTAALVPVLEELFWRGWMMRWLIDSKDFLKVPLGTTSPSPSGWSPPSSPLSMDRIGR